MPRNVELSSKAEADLFQVAAFIARDNPFYANEVVSKILDGMELLGTFPFLGKARSDGLREIVEPQYRFRVVYDVGEDSVRILSIFKFKNDL